MSISHVINRTSQLSSFLITEANRNQKCDSIAKRRYSDSCGKIVKNSKRMKTQQSNNNIYQDQINKRCRILTEINQHVNYKSKQKMHKYILKSELNINTYQQKLAAYQKNKRQIFKELGSVQKCKEITKLIKPNKQNINEHFLTSTLKQSLECYKLRKNEINKKQVKISAKKNDVQESKIAKGDERKVFIQRLDHQIRLQGKLRKLKMQITPYNKRQLKSIINNIFSPYEYEQDKLMKIDYEQFQPYFASTQNLNNTISPETIAQKLIQSYQMCQNYWKQNLQKKFNNLYIKELFSGLNSESKLQLDLKAFTRQINSYFGRNYLSKDLFKIYERICPITKINFIYSFSQ